jgi:hypothetical protein
MAFVGKQEESWVIVVGMLFADIAAHRIADVVAISAAATEPPRGYVL